MKHRDYFGLLVGMCAVILSFNSCHEVYSWDRAQDCVEITVSVVNALGTDADLRMEGTPWPDNCANSVAMDTVLHDGDSVNMTVSDVVLYCGGLVTVTDCDYTHADGEEEVLASFLESMVYTDIVYIEGGAVCRYAENGISVLAEHFVRSERCDSVFVLRLTKELMNEVGVEKHEGQEARASLYWRNDFTLPVGVSIEAEGYAAVETELQPGDSVKIADLDYYTFADEEELSGEMLRKAMSAYHAAIGKASLDLPEMPDAVDGGDYNMGDISGAVNTLFDITAYAECGEGEFTLSLYNRMLYFDLICELDSEAGWEKTVRRVVWENGMDDPMTIDLTYVENKIYTLGGDVHCTLQPGGTLELSTFAIYANDNPSFQAWIDSYWDMYYSEVESLRITCGEKIYDMEADGRGAFLESYKNYAESEEGYVFTFTEETFGGGE